MIDFDLKAIDNAKENRGKKQVFLNSIDNFISVYTRYIVYKTIIASYFKYCATLLINMEEPQLSK